MIKPSQILPVLQSLPVGAAKRKSNGKRLFTYLNKSPPSPIKNIKDSDCSSTTSEDEDPNPHYDRFIKERKPQDQRSKKTKSSAQLVSKLAYIGGNLWKIVSEVAEEKGVTVEVPTDQLEPFQLGKKDLDLMGKMKQIEQGTAPPLNLSNH